VDSTQPLPVIHKVLKDLSNATIFSTLDLGSGYWQISLTDRAQKYTARECCMHYLDHVCVYSRSWPEHLVQLAKVIEQLSTYCLTCAVDKCSIGKRNWNF
jgi:hypothetical protein